MKKVQHEKNGMGSSNKHPLITTVNMQPYDLIENLDTVQTDKCILQKVQRFPPGKVVVKLNNLGAGT